MRHCERPRVGYVVSRYPRDSETFIVDEILAHEQAGLDIDVFALRPPIDTHFQDRLGQVRATVRHLYLPGEGLTAEELTAALLRADALWKLVEDSSKSLPGLWSALEGALGEQVRDVYQGLMMAREVRSRGICHLHAHFAGRPTTVARLAARFAGVPYTFTAHAGDVFTDGIRCDEWQRKLSGAAKVVAVSDCSAAYLRGHFGGVAAPIERIYCGLDLERFRYETPHDRPPRVLAVGRLMGRNGFADLIESCAILASRGLDFSCHLIGTGPLEAELYALIERRGLRAKVELLGRRPQCEVFAFIRTAAVLAVPCVVGVDGNRDDLPAVLIEAMALGTPCISTDVGGIPEVLRQAETGLIVPQHNPAELAAALERLLAEPALRLRLSTGARRVVESEFNIHRTTERLRSIFSATAEADNGAPSLSARLPAGSQTTFNGNEKVPKRPQGAR